MMKKISFLGLGKMGSVMAPLFIEAGHQLTVFNRDKDKAEPLRNQGASIASNPSEAFPAIAGKASDGVRNRKA